MIVVVRPERVGLTIRCGRHSHARTANNAAVRSARHLRDIVRLFMHSANPRWNDIRIVKLVVLLNLRVCSAIWITHLKLVLFTESTTHYFRKVKQYSFVPKSNIPCENIVLKNDLILFYLKYTHKFMIKKSTKFIFLYSYYIHFLLLGKR